MIIILFKSSEYKAVINCQHITAKINSSITITRKAVEMQNGRKVFGEIYPNRMAELPMRTSGKLRPKVDKKVHHPLMGCQSCYSIGYFRILKFDFHVG